MFYFSLFLLLILNINKVFSESWDTRETVKVIQAKQTLTALKSQENCLSSSSLSSILAIDEALSEQLVEKLAKPMQQNFVCHVNKYIKMQNQETEEDQKFMLDYIEKRKNNPEDLSEEDHLLMTEKLIQYRLLRNAQGKEYYVSATRFQPPSETKRKIKELARSYGLSNDCFFVQENKIQKTKITSDACRDEIITKVQSIPPPLVLSQAILESNWGNSSLASSQSNILGLQVNFRQPETMPNYPYCRPARKDPKRCLLKFSDYGGSIYEYYARFNGSHLSSYKNYRKSRLDLYNQNKSMDVCKKSVKLTRSIDFYAENPHYITEIQNMIDSKACALWKNCDTENKVKVADRKSL